MNGWPWPVEVNTHKVVETEDTKGISFKYFQNNKNIYKIEKIYNERRQRCMRGKDGNKLG